MEIKTLKQKVNEDYVKYLALCITYSESPRTKNEDFYTHRNWIVKNNKK